MVCATSNASDQPAQMHSLIRVFASRLKLGVKQLTEHNLEFLSLKGGCTGSSESTLVKILHCWKSRVTAHCILRTEIVSDHWSLRLLTAVVVCGLLVLLIVCFVALRPKSTAMVMAGRSVHLTTPFLGKLEQTVNQYFVHKLSLVTDNNPWMIQKKGGEWL